MKLVITEKNIAADNIAKILATGKPKTDKVYSTPVYRFTRDGEEWVCVGLKGHILQVEFPEKLTYAKRKGWQGVKADGDVLPAEIPDSLARPPYSSKRKPFLADGIDLKGWKVPSLPYLVYAPVWKAPAEKDIIRTLSNLARKSSSVVIATDFDREGELIGADALGVVLAANPELEVSRVRYSAITKAEIEHAFANPVDLDTSLAAAGESRQSIDLIWGAVLTRYLTAAKYSGFGNVRSAGRVQTPTLALVVAREKERDAFVPEDYWEIKASFKHNDDEFTAMHADGRFKREADALGTMEAIEGATTGTVTDIEKKKRTMAPPTPFNTTALMAAAAAEGISPARTMRIAESLYMNGLTSYPRVDNTYYPDSLDLTGTLKMLTGVPEYRPYAEQLLKKGKLKPTHGKKRETDHPPIYPTGVGDRSKLRADEWKIYNLIARRFMATLSDAAVVEGTKVTVDVNGEPFAAKGDVLVKKGYRAIYPYGLKKDEQLPVLVEGDVVDFLGAELLAKQTQPPARYSQGTLLQEMEKNGLGTKSTRHSIIERLYEVRYIVNESIEPTELGRAVIDALGEFAPHITSPDMTAQLEDEMSSIAAGERSEDAVVNHSRGMLAEIMDELVPRKAEVGEKLSAAVTADSRVGTCPSCGGDLLVKSSAKTRGSFIGCNRWPECDVTYPLPQGKVEAADEPCPVCGKPQIKLTPFRQKAQLHCVDPDCPSNQEPDVELGPCPVCAAAGREGTLVAQKSSRTLKRFVRCTNYDVCNTSSPLPGRGEITATDEVCEHCGYPLAVVKTRRGPWKLCTNTACPGKEEGAKKKPAKRGTKRGSKRTSKKSGS